VAACSLLSGWPFGAAFLAPPLVHEIGHTVELPREDRRPGGRANTYYRVLAKHGFSVGPVQLGLVVLLLAGMQTILPALRPNCRP
jgi:hypothetical protein